MVKLGPSPPMVSDVGVSIEFVDGYPQITPKFNFGSPHISATGLPPSMSVMTAKKLRDLLSSMIEIAEKGEKHERSS